MTQRRRQRLQAIAGQHEFLQVRTFTQFARQGVDAVVRQDQPAQQRWQGGAGDVGDAVGLEANHRQGRALAKAGGQRGELVVGAEQHAQSSQTMQVIRQAAQGVAAEIEDFQGVGQIEDFCRELGQAAGQVQPRDARQFAGAQLSKGVHEGIRK